MDTDRVIAMEGRALRLAVWGNLLMCVAGLVTAVLSNSTAIMLDGLFSLIGVIAALVGRQVSRNVEAGPNRLRPFGYASDEAIFLTFRALSLLGLILFAATSAGMTIYRHLTGEPVPVLDFAPMAVYFGLIFVVCFLLWLLHRRTWQRTGRISEMLRLEAKAAIFDAVITAATGAGILMVYLFQDGWLAPVAPIGDSLIVLVLCVTVIGQYWRDLIAGLRQLAGVTAEPKVILTAGRALRPSVAASGGALTDFSVNKLGRTCLVLAYFDPRRPVTAAEIDRLNLQMIRDVRRDIPGADVMLIVSEHARRWPDAISPY